MFCEKCKESRPLRLTERLGLLSLTNKDFWWPAIDHFMNEPGKSIWHHSAGNNGQCLLSASQFGYHFPLGEANLIFWFAYRGRVIILLRGERISFPIIAGQTISLPFFHLKNISIHAYYGKKQKLYSDIKCLKLYSKKKMTFFHFFYAVGCRLVSQRRDLTRLKAKVQKAVGGHRKIYHEVTRQYLFDFSYFF